MMKKTHLSVTIAATLLTLLAGCSNDSNNGTPSEEELPATLVMTKSELHADGVCYLDSDCKEGTFCFNSVCLSECNSTYSCPNQYVCDERSGRCLDKSYLRSRAMRAASRSSEVDLQKAAAEQAKQDIEWAKYGLPQSVVGQTNEAGKVIDVIPFKTRLPHSAWFDGDKVKLLFSTHESIGDVRYAYRVGEGEPTILRSASRLENRDGSVQYAFTLDSADLKDAFEGQNGIIVPVEIYSTVGTYHVDIREVPKMSNVYRGYATAKALSGITIPIRMGIATSTEVKDIHDIMDMAIFLPVSSEDLFSPESVTLGETTWARLTMTRESAVNCSSGTHCFSATFSTNDFSLPNSVILDGDQHINRSLRIEVNDFDPATRQFHGMIIDEISGLYRETAQDATGNHESWNDTELIANFVVTADETLDLTSLSVHDHVPANTALRDLDEAPKDVCSDDDFIMLKNVVDMSECINASTADQQKACEALDTCLHAPNLEAFKALDDETQTICVNAITDGLLNDGARISVVLQSVLQSGSADGAVLATVCDQEIHNFKDLQEACQLSTCDACQPKTTYDCAADLVARQILAHPAVSEDQTTAWLKTWSQLTTESYLPVQFFAWNADNDIRKNWLEGAVYDNTFAASLMDEWNADLLKRFQTEVLKQQFEIMHKQSRQTTLEMLAQSMDADAIEARSLRNAILSDIATGWEAAVESLSYAAKRYDIMTQNDVDRQKAAAELKQNLFDLYFDAMISSKLNKDADQSSLNASFGTNLSDALQKLESLSLPFENLVFMREGKIFTDTRVDPNNNTTTLGALKQAAGKSVNKAVETRKSVFDELNKRDLEALDAQDQYQSALNAIRAQLIDLCGYPQDCVTPDDRQKCEILTQPYYCGFDLATKADGAALSSDTAVNVSQAANAITQYREATQKYETAVSEYDVLLQKVVNEYQMLLTYNDNLKTWYDNRQKTIASVKANLDKLESLTSALDRYEWQALSLKADEVSAEYTKMSNDLDDWATLTATAVSTTTAAYAAWSAVHGVQRWQYLNLFADMNTTLLDTTKQAAEQVITSGIGASIPTRLGIMNDTKGLFNQLFTLSLDVGIRGASDLATAYGFYSTFSTAQENVKLKELQNDLTKQLLETQKSSYDLDSKAAIQALENLNTYLSLENEAETTYQRDLNTFSEMRMKHLDSVLELADRNESLVVQYINQVKALNEYLMVTQQADLLASQYALKKQHLDQLSSLMFSANQFFQTASDLKVVENSIESARNDLNDYLTAIEYMTVRPFVALRRSIYTARGTNELEKLYEQTNELVDRCGTGIASTNRVIVSLKDRMDIPPLTVNDLTPEDRFHTIMAAGNLPVSAQSRYSVNDTAAKLLKDGQFYSGSFVLDPSFANLSTSCNAKIDHLQVRFISKTGAPIANAGVAPTISIFYGGQGKLLSCHSKITNIVESIGSLTSFGQTSVFTTKPFADGLVASIYNVPEGVDYQYSDNKFEEINLYYGLQNFPLMATYTIVFDPNKGENSKIQWDNVADIEIQFTYTTGSLGKSGNNCQYDL